MGTFQITGPDGKKYRVTGETPEGAMKALRGMVDRSVPAATGQPPGVPEFNPGVKGYNPETGNVERSKTMSALAGAADAATFGFGDEIGGALITGAEKLRGNEADYSTIRNQIRGDQADAQADNPKSFLAGQIGGGVAQAIGSGGAGLLARAPTLGARVIGGAATGGAYGAAHGLGSGEGMTDRLKQGAIEGGIGAATGGAFPLLAKGVSGAYRGIVDTLMGRQAAKQAGTTPEVLQMLGRTFEADGTRGPVGQANMARAGKDAMLADAGPNAKAILDTAIQRGGPGGVSARNAIAQRTDRAGQAVNDALDTTLGQPQGVTATRTAIRQGSAASRGSAYDKAYNSPIDYADPRGMEIESIIKTRVPQSAINEANALMRAEGNHSKQILAKVADDGTVTFETLPDVRQLDYITRGLNEVADQADGAGKLGGTTAKGRAYQNLSGEIRDTLRDLVPDYGAALDTAADPIRRSKAVELGSKLLSPAMTRDQVEESVRGMSRAEKDALAQGVRSRLDDLMANVTRTVQDGDTGAREAVKAIKDLSSRANREKLETVLGKPQADALFDEIDRAATSFDLRASVSENSKTFARLETDRTIKGMTEPGVIANSVAAPAQPLNTIRKIAKTLTGQSPARVQAKQDAIYSQLAEVLTRGGPQAQSIFNAIDGMGQSGAASKLMAEKIARALSGPRLTYPTTTLLSDKARQYQGR